ncbi:MAG TPA: hypothetical protein GX527_12295 [Clostridiaceae bacterium]|jgi:V/A-type H+-transporting ATPase subunit E|nr:hypothetical protein [Clostridiaceae bacterium]
MEGAEKIIERIIEDANLQAKNNIEQAEKQASNIILSAQKEAEKKKNDILEKTKKEAEEKKNRLIAVAELEGRKIKLKAKQDVISEVIKEALGKLNAMSSEQYSSIIINMVVSSVIKGNEEIIVSRNDKARLGNNFIDKVNRMLKEKNINGSIKFSDKSDEIEDIGGGFILRSGDIETNNSFETIIRMKYNEIEAGIVKILFG